MHGTSLFWSAVFAVVLLTDVAWLAGCSSEPVSPRAMPEPGVAGAARPAAPPARMPVRSSAVTPPPNAALDLGGGGEAPPDPQLMLTPETVPEPVADSGPPAPVADAEPPLDTSPGVPTDLSVGDRARPMNVEGAPLFGWRPHDGPNEIQTAYQIRVLLASDASVVWDSDKVSSSEQAYVTYGGPGLARQTSYEWTVRTWDRDDQPSPWAALAEFDTGLSDADWGASWIRRASTDASPTTSGAIGIKPRVSSPTSRGASSCT